MAINTSYRQKKLFMSICPKQNLFKSRSDISIPPRQSLSETANAIFVLLLITRLSATIKLNLRFKRSNLLQYVDLCHFRNFVCIFSLLDDYLTAIEGIRSFLVKRSSPNKHLFIGELSAGSEVRLTTKTDGRRYSLLSIVLKGIQWTR